MIHLFYGKRRYLFLLIYLAAISVILFTGYTEDASYLQRLDPESYRLYTEGVGLQFMRFFYLVFTAVLAIDHDQQAYTMLIPYFGRSSIFLIKALTYSMVLLFWSILLYLSWFSVLIVMTDYYTYHLDLNEFFIHLYLNQLLLLIFSFALVRREKHHRILILLLVFIIYPMLREDLNLPILKWLLPISSAADGLDFIYKLCYILLGLFLVLVREEKRQIY